MPYYLSVDLGTTFSSAAINEDNRVEIFQLGSGTAVIPSVVSLRPDGTVLTGEAADRRGITEPTRVAREFKRRLGDPTPMVIGGTPYGSETLMADLLSAIVAQVAQQQAGPATAVILSHPANYGPFKLDLLAQVGHLAEIDNVGYIPEPEAAAIHYLNLQRIDSGEVVAVYDLGGGTFDAALVRRTETGFEPMGTPDGMERFGGVDLDEAVFDHVRRFLGRAMDSLDPNDPTVTSALMRLREDCREAKEGLSSDTDAAIPVMLPNVHTEVRLTRSEFEDVIRPRLRETITMLERVVRSAGLDFGDLSQVLLVGGSSRIPLVGEMVGEATGRPIGLGAHPKHAIVLGAAAAAEAVIGRSEATTPPVAAESPEEESPGPAAASAVIVTEAEPEFAASPPLAPQPAEPGLDSEEPSRSEPVEPAAPIPLVREHVDSVRRRSVLWRRRGLLWAVIAAVVVAAAATTVFVFLNGASTDGTVPEAAAEEPAGETGAPAGDERVVPAGELVVPIRLAVSSGEAALRLVGGAIWDPVGVVDMSGPDVDTASNPEMIMIGRRSGPEAGPMVEALFEVSFRDVGDVLHFVLERSDPGAFVEISFPTSPVGWIFAAEGEPNPTEFQVARHDIGE